MTRLLHVLNNLERYLLAAFMAAITFVVFIQVIFRQRGQSLPWSEELTRYLLVWITMIGAAQGIKKAVHVGVEAFTLLLPLWARKVLHIVVLLICVFFCVIVGVFALFIIRVQFINHQVTPAMRVPMWTAYAALPAGALLMVVRYVQVIVRAVKEFRRDYVVTGLED
ncbi:MAG: TRAP transporter small permease [Synergistaceae bacterium]|jgi:C4-dicarboxylate transporter DctQ subunit|nr:TRAP transporter small permease [Synergistaceae bacterium]